MVNHKYKFIFIHINRTGGTSWERAFHLKQKHDHRGAMAIRKSQPEAWSNYFKFAIVRNPWDRYLSVYTKRRTYEPFFKRTTFVNWIKYLHKQFKRGRLLGKSFFGNQLPWITDKQNNIIIDYVGRFENYAEEWKKICNIVGATNEIVHVNSTPHEHYSKYYNQNAIDMVATIAANDIKTFGYEFENK